MNKNDVLELLSDLTCWLTYSKIEDKISQISIDKTFFQKICQKIDKKLCKQIFNFTLTFKIFF